MDDRGPEVGQAQIEFSQTRHGRELERLMARARQAGVGVRGHLESGDPAQVILRLARELRADSIVMGAHGRTGLAHLLLGSVAERVLRHAPCGVVLVGKEPEHAAAAPA